MFTLIIASVYRHKPLSQLRCDSNTILYDVVRVHIVVTFCDHILNRWHTYDKYRPILSSCDFYLSDEVFHFRDRRSTRNVGIGRRWRRYFYFILFEFTNWWMSVSFHDETVAVWSIMRIIYIILCFVTSLASPAMGTGDLQQYFSAHFGAAQSL